MSRIPLVVYLAAKGGLISQVRELVRADPDCVHQSGKSGNTALLAAVFGNAPTAILDELIAAGSNIRATNKQGRTVLHLAFISYRADSARIAYLLDAGAAVDARDKDGKTPLMYAVRYGALLEAIDTLLDRGADINATDAISGIGALHIAASHFPDQQLSDPAMVKHLLAAGADASILDHEGNTALHCAAFIACGDTDVHAGASHSTVGTVLSVIELLLNAGVPRGATNNLGRSAHNLTLKCGTTNQEILTLLGPRTKSAVM